MYWWAGLTFFRASMDFRLGVRVVEAGGIGGGLRDSRSSSLVPSLLASTLPARMLSPLPQNELERPLVMTRPSIPGVPARRVLSGVPEVTSMFGTSCTCMSGLVTRPPLGRVPLIWMMSVVPSCDCSQDRQTGRLGRDGGRDSQYSIPLPTSQEEREPTAYRLNHVTNLF